MGDVSINADENRCDGVYHRGSVLGENSVRDVQSIHQPGRLPQLTHAQTRNTRYLQMTSLWISLLLLGFGILSMAEAASEPLAEVDGIAITSEEVEKPLASQLSKLAFARIIDDELARDIAAQSGGR